MICRNYDDSWQVNDVLGDTATSYPCFTDNLESDPEYVNQCETYCCPDGGCNCAQYELICCKLNNITYNYYNYVCACMIHAFYVHACMGKIANNLSYVWIKLYKLSILYKDFNKSNQLIHSSGSQVLCPYPAGGRTI